MSCIIIVQQLSFHIVNDTSQHEESNGTLKNWPVAHYFHSFFGKTENRFAKPAAHVRRVLMDTDYLDAFYSRHCICVILHIHKYTPPAC